MAWEIVLSTFSMAGEGQKVMNPELVDVIDEAGTSYEEREAESVVNNMGYRMQKLLNPQQQISSKVWARELKELTEGQVIPMVERGKGPDKGMKVKIYGGKHASTKLAHDWANSTQTLSGADPSVKTSIAEMVESIKDLRKGATLDKAIDATRVITEGWSGTNDYGPGSLTPKGLSLFSDSHTYRGWTKNFRNILWGSFGTANTALADASLQNALDIHKQELRMENGHRVISPDTYMLMIPRELEVTAGEILNTDGHSAWLYSGQGTNSNEINSFYFKGNKVAYMTNPFIGYESDEFGSIGAGTNWFVINPNAMRQNKALRYGVLNPGEVESFYDPQTKNHFVTYYHTCAFDHYGAESYIVGSEGTA